MGAAVGAADARLLLWQLHCTEWVYFCPKGIVHTNKGQAFQTYAAALYWVRPSSCLAHLSTCSSFPKSWTQSFLALWLGILNWSSWRLNLKRLRVNVSCTTRLLLLERDKKAVPVNHIMCLGNFLEAFYITAAMGPLHMTAEGDMWNILQILTQYLCASASITIQFLVCHCKMHGKQSLQGMPKPIVEHGSLQAGRQDA